MVEEEVNWSFFINKWTAVRESHFRRTEYTIKYDPFFALYFANAIWNEGFTVRHFYLGSFQDIEVAKRQAELFDSDPIKNPAKIAFDLTIGRSLT